jgi:hypothetical protein
MTRYARRSETKREERSFTTCVVYPSPPSHKHTHVCADRLSSSLLYTIFLTPTSDGAAILSEPPCGKHRTHTHARLCLRELCTPGPRFLPPSRPRRPKIFYGRKSIPIETPRPRHRAPGFSQSPAFTHEGGKVCPLFLGSPICFYFFLLFLLFLPFLFIPLLARILLWR